MRVDRLTKPLHYHCANPAIRAFPRNCALPGQHRKRDTRVGHRFAVSHKVAQSVPSLFMETNGPKLRANGERGLTVEGMEVPRG